MTSRKTKPKEQTDKLAGIEGGALVIDDVSSAPVPAVIEPVQNSMMAVIARASTDPRCNTDKMRALLDMQKEITHDERRIAYNTAMWCAQGEMEPIVARVWNESTKSFFAKLAHVDNSIRQIYSKHGFSLSFDSSTDDKGLLTMFVDVMHKAGHVERKQLAGERDDKGPKGTPNKTSIQGTASSATILQRKLTVMVFNITFIQEDDDGQGGKKEPLKQDRFTVGAEQAVDMTPDPTLTPVARALLAASALEQRLLAVETLEHKGKLLMTNLRLLKELEVLGESQRVIELRSIAEGKDSNE